MPPETPAQPPSEQLKEKLFIVTAPGLEGLAEGELRDLGLLDRLDSFTASSRLLARRLRVPVSSDEDGGGGVAFTGSLENIYRANLHLRTASRVLVRLGDFYAAGFPELRKKAGRLAWERFLLPGQPVDLHVTCHKSRLYHSGAVAERVLAAIGDRLGKPSPQGQAAGGDRSSSSSARAAGSQMVIVRLVHDHCTISIDSSGELLHRRGYRLATAKAPLRETLAAAMLLAAGWNTVSPLLDPFCGSGTIAIEAAMLARGIPPGRSRRFAFMDWPGYDPETWQALLAENSPRPPVPQAPDDLPSPHPRIPAPPGAPSPRHSPLPSETCPIIQASDRDAGAIRLAQENAARAGVGECIEFTCRAVSAIQPPEEPGWVVTNPPYGIRVSAAKDLRNLYAQLGNVLRARCPGWQVAILCSDMKLLGQTGLRLDTSFSTVNGGVSVRLGRGEV